MTAKVPPTLHTARLLIRPFTLADIDEYHRVLHSDPVVMRYLPGGSPRTREQTEFTLRYFIEHGQTWGFSFEAVCHGQSGAFIGHVGLHRLHDAVEIGYAFGTAYWGHGYASEAARALLNFGFETVGLDSIIALAFPANTASKAVMERLGMMAEGTTDAYYHEYLALYRLRRADFHP
jgi:RimJ/RimL family protein N-acetyltransferase